MSVVNVLPICQQGFHFEFVRFFSAHITYKQVDLKMKHYKLLHLKGTKIIKV